VASGAGAGGVPSRREEEGAPASSSEPSLVRCIVVVVVVVVTLPFGGRAFLASLGGSNPRSEPAAPTFFRSTVFVLLKGRKT